jgi:dsRNA-specific ribonuclease
MVPAAWLADPDIFGDNGETGRPAHSPHFTYRVYAQDDSFPGDGTGRNAAEAKQDAAKMALDKLPGIPK